MEETREQGPSLRVLLVLLAALVLGVILVFTMLEMVIPRYDIPETPVQSETITQTERIPQAEDVPAPGFCPHCGDKLPDSFQWEQFCPYCGEKVQWEDAG